MKHLGLHAHRLRDNPEERRFAAQWQDDNEVGSVLAWLLHLGYQSGRPPAPSEHDVRTAATVIQWLGSPVGQAFLARLGYEKQTMNTRKSKL